MRCDVESTYENRWAVTTFALSPSHASMIGRAERPVTNLIWNTNLWQQTCRNGCGAGETDRQTAGGVAGSRTRNTVRPGPDSTDTVPLWASTMDRTIASPRPVDPISRD